MVSDCKNRSFGLVKCSHITCMIIQHGKKTVTLRFSWTICKYDECQTLHNGTIH